MMHKKLVGPRNFPEAMATSSNCLYSPKSKGILFTLISNRENQKIMLI